MTEFSLRFRKAMFDEQTADIPVALVTITHESLPEPLRFSSDTTVRLSTDPLKYGTISRGETYEFLPMTLVLPDDRESAEPIMSLRIDNVARKAIPLARSITTPAIVTVELVLAGDPDTVEGQWPDFDLGAADYGDVEMNLTLGNDALTNEPYPAGIYSPARFPGLF